MNKHLLVVTLLLYSALAPAETTLIEVFADGPVQVPNVPNATVVTYDLDIDAQVARIKPTFSAASVGEAQAQAMQWRNSAAFDEYSTRVVNIYRPLHRVAELQLRKVPAIVFDETHVVYGTTDLSRAINDYLSFSADQQE